VCRLPIRVRTFRCLSEGPVGQEVRHILSPDTRGEADNINSEKFTLSRNSERLKAEGAGCFIVQRSMSGIIRSSHYNSILL
jgi:hypothetical protein